jgi:hypothetical protein
MAVTTGIAAMMLGSAALSAGTSIYGAKKQVGAAREASRSQDQALDKSLDWEREQEKRRQEEWDRSERMNQQNWEREVAREQMNLDRAREEDTYRDRRKEPIRQAGYAAIADLDARRKGSMQDLLPTGRI